jgi:hypothetical protein
MSNTKQTTLYCVTSAVLLSLYSIMLITTKPFFFPLDDAYIILHNATVLLTGVDHNYIGTPALVGTTSPVHLALTAFLMKMVSFSPAITLFTLNWIYILIYALGICRLAIIYQLNFIQTLMCLFLGLFTGVMPYQLLNGLETGLAISIITWTLVFFSEPLNDFRRVCILFFCALMPFIRPELCVFSFFIYIYLSTLEHRAFGILKNLGILIFFASPWLIWMFVTTGAIYPLTIDAKKAFFANDLNSTLVFFHNIIRFIHLISLPLSLMIIFLWTSANKIGKIALGFMLIFLTSYLFTNPLLISQNYGRYLYIFIPFLLFGGMRGLKDSQLFFQVMAKIFLSVAFIYQIILSPTIFNSYYLGNIHHEQKLFPETVNWCNKNIPKNATILIQDAGYLAFTTQYKLVDIVGLKTPSNIYYHKLLTYPSHGKYRSKAISEIALKYGGQYLILTPEWDRIFHISDDLKKLGWEVLLLHQSAGENGYLIYKLNCQNNKQ